VFAQDETSLVQDAALELGFTLIPAAVQVGESPHVALRVQHCALKVSAVAALPFQVLSDPDL
jgi:hypothetical protein